MIIFNSLNVRNFHLKAYILDAIDLLIKSLFIPLAKKADDDCNFAYSTEQTNEKRDKNNCNVCSRKIRIEIFYFCCFCFLISLDFFFFEQKGINSMKFKSIQLNSVNLVERVELEYGLHNAVVTEYFQRIEAFSSLSHTLIFI